MALRMLTCTDCGFQGTLKPLTEHHCPPVDDTPTCSHVTLRTVPPSCFTCGTGRFAHLAPEVES